MSSADPDKPVIHGAEHLRAGNDPVHPVFHAYDATGAINISAGATDLTWDTEVIKDPAYTHSNDSAEITVTVAGWYKFEVDVTTDVTSGTIRSDSYFYLYHVDDTAIIAGTVAWMYNRQATQGENTASVTRIVELAIDDTVKVVALLNSGSNTITTLANGCRITITKI